jgi:hypothetical protein
MSLSQPDLLLHSVGQTTPDYVNAIPDAPSTAYNFSWETGFQVANMTPISSGGVPPDMKDMNGVLAALSKYAQWQIVGSPFAFSSTFSAAVGGYPQGAVVRDPGFNMHSFVSMAFGTSTDPGVETNVTGAQPGVPGWDFWTTRGPGTAFGFVMHLTDHSSVANAIILHHDVYTAYANGGSTVGAVVIWKQAITNTGACTITVNGTTGNLVRRDGSAVVGGDLVAGTVYVAELDSLSLDWHLLSFLPSYLPAAAPKTYGTDTAAGPIAITSATGQMAGLYFFVQPSSTGRIFLSLSFRLRNNGASVGSTTMQLNYGTGTPPSNGAAPTGTIIGLPLTDSIASGDSVHRSLAATVTLDVGTEYWIDLQISTSATNSSLYETVLSIMEF